ncbi:hypothetical protein O6H91_Y256600 [Diphasiastrum complanatum]|nr:hypothetical protein O6H91_Y256600 [Diphasiastrum complanatum]
MRKVDPFWVIWKGAIFLFTLSVVISATPVDANGSEDNRLSSSIPFHGKDVPKVHIQNLGRLEIKCAPETHGCEVNFTIVDPSNTNLNHEGVQGSDQVLQFKKDLGLDNRISEGSVQRRFWTRGKQADCEESYGFLPCSTNIGGNLFLLVVYGFMLLKAAQLLSNGSELLLTVLNPGLIGGLLLPVLGSLPDALLILGLAASQDQAQAQVLVGMGLLAGSTVMLLTLLWGSSLIVGRCDLYERNGQYVAKERTLTKPFSLSGTGATTDSQTKVAAWIMIMTVIPYLLAQLPRALNIPSLGPIFVIISCVLSFLALISYCIYQVISPWIQQRRTFLARHRFRRSHAVHRAAQFGGEGYGSLFLENGLPNEEFLVKLFGFFDLDNDNQLCEKELKGLIVGLGINYDGYLPEHDEVQNWMNEFDLSQDGQISQKEFVQGFIKWIKGFKLHARTFNGHYKHSKPEYWDAEAQNARTSLSALLEDQAEDNDDEEEANQPTKGQIITQAVFLILGGAVLAGIFADPLVEAISNFSQASGIPSFFISFVATPLATNSSEAISSLMFASRKRKRNISMTYSQIYGAVTLNNTLCLGIFLAIVAARGLVWDFSSEVTVISVVIIVMGLLAGARTTFRLWLAAVALALYPISIAIVAILDYGYGWH